MKQYFLNVNELQNHAWVIEPFLVKYKPMKKNYLSSFGVIAKKNINNYMIRWLNITSFANCISF